MSSPFKTPQEFLEAKGPIYTFGNNPTIIGILLVISTLVLLWFIYASYTIKTRKPNTTNPAILSLLIATSTFTLADLYTSHVKKINSTSSRKAGVPERAISSKQGQGWQVPVAAVGMMAAGNTIQRRYRKKTQHGLQNVNLIWRSLSQGIRIGLSLIPGYTRTSITRRRRRQ